MELKPGYKQTEVGVVPEDWEIKRVGDLGSIVRGGSPRPAGDSRYFNGSFVPWLTVAALTNIPDSQLRVSDTVGFLTEEGAKHSRTLINGTVIIVNSGATLGVAKLLQVTCCANDGIAAIVNQRVGDKEFICHFINSQTNRLREVVATGNGQPNLNTSLIRGIALPFPSSAEQRAIAEVLSDVDALLIGLTRLIAKKRDLKQAAVQQLLTGQTRLPGFSGGWKVVRFSDVADKSIRWSFVGGPFGSNLKASDYLDAGVRIIQLQNIGDGRFHEDYAIFTSEEKADELLSNNIYPSEIILSKMGDPVARACLVPDVDRRYLMASDGIRLAVDQRRFHKRFVHDYINSPYFRKRAVEASTGSTHQRIGLADLKALPFVMPTLAEQTAIAAVLSDMDAEIAALEERLAKTHALKQGMMQELLTGRIRLV